VDKTSKRTATDNKRKIRRADGLRKYKPTDPVVAGTGDDAAVKRKNNMGSPPKSTLNANGGKLKAPAVANSSTGGSQG